MTQETTTARNTRIVLEFFDLVDRHRFEAAAALLSPDFHLYFSGLELDHDQTVAMIRDVYQSFADFTYDVQETLAVDDRVVVRIIDRATHTGTFEGVPATGRPITVGQISIARVVEGKITEIREEADLLTLMQQIGAVPAHTS